MKAVADTNILVSGLLWQGAPRQVLDAARASQVDLFTSAALLAELEEALGRDKFAKRLKSAGVTARELVLGYAALAKLAEPAAIPSVIAEDPDDDAVLACAVGAAAEVIVSGDSHLLGLKQYQDIDILTATELLARLPAE